MSFLDRRFAANYNRNNPYGKLVAEAEADARQDAELLVVTPQQVELNAQAAKAEEERQVLRNYPIGTTIEQARQRGWVK